MYIFLLLLSKYSLVYPLSSRLTQDVKLSEEINKIRSFFFALEDLDLSLRFFLTDAKIGFINYNIRDIIGGTIGTGDLRKLRSISSQAYFEYKNQENLRDYRNLEPWIK